MQLVTFLIIVAATLLAAVVSCAPPSPMAQHTVAEYRADPILRRTVFARCTDDPGGLGKTPDCVNAIEAERQESRGSLRDQAPIGLNPSGKR